MKIVINRYLAILIFSYAFLNNYGQNCTENLLEAEKLFEQGFLEEVPGKLLDCIKKGDFSKEELQDAYKLLIQAYLYDDRQSEADKNMMGFLKKYPEYKIAPTDPDVFRYLYGTYNTSPIFIFSIQFGSNFSWYRLKLKNGTDNTAFNQSEHFPSGTGINGGIKFSKNIYKNFDLELDLLFTQYKTYETDIIGIENDILLYDKKNTVFDLTINSIFTPLSVVYNFRYNRLLPFIRIGFGPDFIPFRSFTTVSGEYIKTGKADIPALDILLYDPKNKEETNYLNRLNYAFLFGTGIKYIIPTGSVSVDLRYNHYLKNFANEKELLQHDQLYLEYEYGMDKFSISNFSYFISYNRSIYKARKKK